MSLLGFQIVDLNWLLFPIIQSIWPTCFERFNKFILLSVTAMLILRNNSSYLLFTKLSHNGFCACTVPRITHLHLSHSLVATNLGVRFIGDVKQVLQHRKESTGDMEAQLQKFQNLFGSTISDDNIAELILGLTLNGQFSFKHRS